MSGPDLSTEVGRRAWEKLIAQEQREIDTEIQEAQHQRELSRAERDRRQRAAALQATERLKALAPAYASRQQAAERTRSALAEFVAIERGLLAEETRVFASVSTSGLDGGQVQQRTLAIRQAAGLPVQHDRLGITPSDPDDAIALTCLLGILAGVIGAGRIEVGSNWINFTFS